jgi:hypothetical protein
MGRDFIAIKGEHSVEEPPDRAEDATESHNGM